MARRSLWPSNIYGSRQFWYSMPGWKSWKIPENPIVHPLCLRIVCEILWHDLNQLGWVTWRTGALFELEEKVMQNTRGRLGLMFRNVQKITLLRSIMDSYGPITSLSVGFFSIPSNFYYILRCFREVQWLHFEDETQGLDRLKGWWFGPGKKTGSNFSKDFQC